MNKKLLKFILPVAVIATGISLFALKTDNGPVVDPNNAGLKLPQGFGALIVAETGAQPRHIVITPQGNIYVKLFRAKNGKGIYYYKADPSGKATLASSFGNYPGTGMNMKGDYLYASSNTEVFRYKIDEKKEVIDPEKPERIITGLKTGQHESKSIVFDNADNIYVNIGVNSNSCQVKDRQFASMGIPGCPYWILLQAYGG